MINISRTQSPCYTFAQLGELLSDLPECVDLSIDTDMIVV